MDGARAESPTVDYRRAVAAAVRAPSLHNSQPWRFQVRGDRLAVRLDPRRRLPASDPAGWGARIAAGAALFNLRIAVAMQGWQPGYELLPDPADPDLVAELWPEQRRRPTRAEERLWRAIWRRHSNRSPFWPDPVPADARAALVTAAQAEGCWLEPLIGAGPANALAQIAQTANQVLMRDPAYRAELAAWLRTGRPATDGVPAERGLPADAGALADAGRLDLVLPDLLPLRPFGGRPGRGAGDEFNPQPMVAVLGTTGDTPGDQLVAGQGLQRVLLTATDAGLAVSMVSQPIEVASAREQVRLALRRSGSPQMVLRVGYGIAGSVTPRRPVAEVFEP